MSIVIDVFAAYGALCLLALLAFAAMVAAGAARGARMGSRAVDRELEAMTRGDSPHP